MVDDMPPPEDAGDPSCPCTGCRGATRVDLFRSELGTISRLNGNDYYTGEQYTSALNHFLGEGNWSSRVLEHGYDELDDGFWALVELDATIWYHGEDGSLVPQKVVKQQFGGQSVTFYANVVTGEANMLCGLRLSKFGLFGDLLLIDGDITYQPAKSIIQGSVKLTLPDLSTYANPQLTASMLLQKNQTYVLAQLEVGREVNIDNPFDLMYNTSLGIAKVEATFTKPNGSIDLAPCRW